MPYFLDFDIIGPFRTLTCIFASIPAVYVLFRVLQSYATIVAERRAGAQAVGILALMPNWYRFIPLVRSVRIEFSGGAAGFLLTFLLAEWAFYLSYHPQINMAVDWLVGDWIVINGSEPDLFATWSFSQNEDQPVRVEGNVWRVSQDWESGEKEQVMHFGPFDVDLEPGGQIHFCYESKLGQGHAYLQIAYGLMGHYTDDPTRSPPGQTDSGKNLLYKEELDADGYRLRAMIAAAVVTVMYSWIVAGLAYFAFRVLCSNARVRSGAWTLAGPVAFYYVLYTTLVSAGSLKPAEVRFSEATLPGIWRLEYLDVDKRDRYGSLTIAHAGEGYTITAALFRRDNPQMRRVTPRTNALHISDARFDRIKRTFEFSYDTPVGAGDMILSEARTMVGFFTDDIKDIPDNNTNAGDFVAVKR